MQEKYDLSKLPMDIFYTIDTHKEIENPLLTIFLNIFKSKCSVPTDNKYLGVKNSQAGIMYFGSPIPHTFSKELSLVDFFALIDIKPKKYDVSKMPKGWYVNLNQNKDNPNFEVFKVLINQYADADYAIFPQKVPFVYLGLLSNGNIHFSDFQIQENFVDSIDEILSKLEVKEEPKETEWQPKVGELCLVKDKDSYIWREAIFVVIFKGLLYFSVKDVKEVLIPCYEYRQYTPEILTKEEIEYLTNLKEKVKERGSSFTYKTE